MTTATPAEEATGNPPANLFAGADKIEDEDLGNFGEYFDNPPPVPGATPEVVPPVEVAPEVAAEPPVEEAPPAELAAEEPPVDPATAEAAPEIEPPPPVETEEEADQQETSVPSYRLAQEAARRRQAESYAQDMERQLQDAQQQLQQQVQPPVPQVPTEQPPQAAAAPQPIDLGDDPKQMFDKVLDGDLDKATQLFTDMMQKATAAQQQPVQQANIPTPEDMKAVVAQQVHEMSMREAELSVIETLESKYEVFNPNSANFNKDLVDETLMLKNTYVGQSYTPADAMERASAMVLNMNGIATATPTAPANPAAVPNTAAVKRNVDALNAQPPQMPAGAQQQGVPEININNLSQEDFEALPEATIARMRGDLL
jgi:hypothetical protein